MIRENLETNSFTRRAGNAHPHSSEFLKDLYAIQPEINYYVLGSLTRFLFRKLSPLYLL